MSTGAIIVLIVAIVVVLALGAWLVQTQLRSSRLRARFGSEYDRAIADGANRRVAERELTEREKRHRGYDIKPLSPTVRQRYEQQWTLVQQRFVDEPSDAVAEAERLVTIVMGERGYPTESYEQQAADLSVRHAGALEHYRGAHDIHTRHGDSPVSTEELREAMVHYRHMFAALIEKTSVDGAVAREDTRTEV